MYFIRVSWKSIADVETEEGREGGGGWEREWVGGSHLPPLSSPPACAARRRASRGAVLSDTLGSLLLSLEPSEGGKHVML